MRRNNFFCRLLRANAGHALFETKKPWKAGLVANPAPAPSYSAGAMTTPRYRKALQALLTRAEHRLFSRLDRPQKIQDFLDKVPANFEPDGDTARSPRGMLKARVAHCSEAAVFAAAVLLYHGRGAWLMDLRALPSDQDHIVTLFKRRGLWGAISKTNHAILRWRDPIYTSVRELAMSYAHEYCLPGGKKSMLSYSRPFSLTRYPPKRWVVSPDDLDWLLYALDLAPHLPLAPPHAMRIRRRSARVELEAQEVLEWPRPRQRKTETKRRKRPPE